MTCGAGGTTVSRASVHNVSIVKELKLGIGDRITVYKANMIIPQIAENLTKSGTLEIPCTCPVCQGETRIVKENDTETLVCPNQDCDAKKIKSFTLFVSRDAMNIDGLPKRRWKNSGGRLFAYLCGSVPSGQTPGCDYTEWMDSDEKS